MNLSEHFEQLRTFDVWANRAFVDALGKLEDPPARCLEWLAHIIAAEHVWLSRLRGEPAPLPVWPKLTLTDCAAHVATLGQGWSRYFAEHLPQDLESAVSYKNSKGEGWNSKVRDILTHVFMHSTHHRGQIASEMRAAGYAPPYTDFIHATRQGLID